MNIATILSPAATGFIGETISKNVVIVIFLKKVRSSKVTKNNLDFGVNDL